MKKLKDMTTAEVIARDGNRPYEKRDNVNIVFKDSRSTRPERHIRQKVWVNLEGHALVVNDWGIHLDDIKYWIRS